MKKMSEGMTEIISNALSYIETHKQIVVTSDVLLKVMMEQEGSYTKKYLSEYEFDLVSLQESRSKYMVIPIPENETRFSSGVSHIFFEAEKIAEELEEDQIYEEHVLLAMLESSCLAQELLYDCDIDVEMLTKELRIELGYAEKTSSTILDNYTKNYTKLVCDPSWVPYVSVSQTIERLYHILKRKTKSNPMIIGQAGVGKTAVVEGLAKYFVDQHLPYEVIGLELSGVVAGTKYRGDFEERLLELIREVEGNPYRILFIDEIHNLLGAGSSDGSMDAANILKPALARGSIKCIGATTMEEYRKTIETDKALQRRFQPVFIHEPSLTETKQILQGIKPYYEKFHHVSMDDSLLSFLMEETNQRLPQRVFPDKAIDVLDETLTSLEIKGKKSVDKEDILSSLAMMEQKKQYTNDVRQIYLPFLLSDLLHVYPRHHLFTFLVYGEFLEGSPLRQEIQNTFQYLPEEILEIDLSIYNESHTKSSLIGAPPGYVGFEQGGILSEHLGTYPHALLILKHFEQGHLSIQSFFHSIQEKGFFYDAKSRKCNCNQVGYIEVIEKKKEKPLGFLSQAKPKQGYDLILEDTNLEATISFSTIMERKGYELIPKSMYQHPQKEKLFYQLLTNYPPGFYSVIYEEGKDVFHLKKVDKEEEMVYNSKRSR